MAKVVDDSDHIRTSILPPFKISCENRFSWRLRFAIAEHAAQICGYVSKSCVNEDILSFYELLLRDGEPEVRSEAIANIPKVAKYCSKEILIEKVLPILKEQMANDSSQHVKGSMAQAICELAEYLSESDII